MIVGAGGHGREVLDIIEAIGGFEVLGFVDDGAPDVSLLTDRGHELLGGTDALTPRATCSSCSASGIPGSEPTSSSGSRRPRRRRLSTRWASVGSSCRIGAGLRHRRGARLTTNITVGRHCYVGPNATIGHDAVLEDFATSVPGRRRERFGPLGRAATVGAAASVKQGMSVGARAVVGMGAAATHDVPDGATVVGVPARRIGQR